MAEALLDAGAVVYAVDRLPPSEQSPDFEAIQARAKNELGTSLSYRQIDVRDNASLNETIKGIADETGRMDGLVAAAGIQQETPAIDYTQEDANRMFEVDGSQYDVDFADRDTDKYNRHFHDLAGCGTSISATAEAVAFRTRAVLNGIYRIDVRHSCEQRLGLRGL